MKKELNIAAILKDKPQGTKLYDWLYNIDIELDTISTTDTETVVWCTNETDNNTTCHRGYSEFGTVRNCPNGLQILLPSRGMRDWSKFSWKKGDVLVSNDGKREVLFKTWENDSYTKFVGLHCLIINDNEEVEYDNGTTVFNTNDFKGIEAEDAAQTYINTIEERFCGKLNLKTLEIEKQPKQEFKDGDIVHIPAGEFIDEAIFIAKVETKGVLHSYVYMSKDSMIPLAKSSFRVFGCLDSLRLATENEQQQLFSALEKKGKRWNPDTKQIEDLPKKCEFKPMDWCLMKDPTKYWELCQFAYTRKVHGTTIYSAVGGLIYYKCIPYNEETKHLLGTTDDWKGGE